MNKNKNQTKTCKLLCFLVLTLLGANLEINATTYRTVDLEPNASIRSSDNYLLDSGKTYRYNTKQDPEEPWLSPSQSWEGSYGLALDILKSPTSGKNDKSEYIIVNEQVTHPLRPNDDSAFVADRFYGFAIKLAPNGNFKKPNADVMLFQCWQGSPHKPPLVWRIIDTSSNTNTRMHYQLWTRKDSNRTGNPSVRKSGTLDVGSWYEVAFRLRPSWTGNNGNLKMWLRKNNNLRKDDDDIYNANFDWGYKPEASPYNGADGVNRKMAIANMIYREHQGGNKRHRVFFDQMKYGTDFDSVNP